MSMLDELRDLFPDAVLVRRATRGPSGDRVYTSMAQESIPARVVEGNEVVAGPAGREVGSTIAVLLWGIYGVKVEDEFTLPERFTPRQPDAVAIRQISDENGPLYEKVFF